MNIITSLLKKCTRRIYGSNLCCIWRVAPLDFANAIWVNDLYFVKYSMKGFLNTSLIKYILLFVSWIIGLIKCKIVSAKEFSTYNEMFIERLWPDPEKQCHFLSKLTAIISWNQWTVKKEILINLPSDTIALLPNVT